MKTTTRLIGVVAIAMVLSIAFSGVALACCPVPETTCTSKIDTETIVQAYAGSTVIEAESLTFQQATRDLAAHPPLAPQEMYANTRYSEDMTARAGVLSFTKILAFDSGNSDGVPDVNLDVAKSFNYVATPGMGGGLTLDEMVAIDAISRVQFGAPTMCRFALPGPNTIPESCEYVDAGSTLDVTEVAFTSNTETITTAMSSDVTPITMHYDISAGDTLLTNTVGAVGRATAFMSVHDMEGRRLAPPIVPPLNTLGSVVEFEEEISVDGRFELYKEMDYVSGILLMP